MPPSGDNLPRKPDPLAVLYGAGAHFVLLHDKVPVWAKWQRRRPPLDVVHAHGDRLGLMPASIGTSALDVDEGDPRELLAHHPAWAVLASRRPGGRHLYYADDRPRGNRTWAEYGCAGQLRSGRGYLVLWHDGADRLAEELRTRGRPADFRLPDLFAAAGVELPTVYPADLDRGPAIMAPARVVLPMLEVVLPGGRNPALFDTVRHWAYREDRGRGLRRWIDRVRDYGRQHNGRFPVPLDDDEVQRLAWNVSSWTWAGGGPLDHSPEAQRRRGRASGRKRRKRTADRDREIVADRVAGLSQREIATKHGMSRGGVENVLKRDAPLFAQSGALLATIRAPRP